MTVVWDVFGVSIVLFAVSFVGAFASRIVLSFANPFYARGLYHYTEYALGLFTLMAALSASVSILAGVVLLAGWAMQ